MSNDVRFIRKNGRVIPVRGKGSAPKGSRVSKRYGANKDQPKAKSLGVFKGAGFGAAAASGAKFLSDAHKKFKQINGMMTVDKLGNAKKISKLGAAESALKITAHVSKSKIVKAATVGALAGAAVGSLKFYKRGKGESQAQLSKRASGFKKKNKSGV